MRLAGVVACLAVLAIASPSLRCVPIDGDIDVGVPDECLANALCACTASEQCPDGLICTSSGDCVPGECDPAIDEACDSGEAAGSPFCCDEREICSPLDFTCVDDPNARPEVCEPADASCVQCSSQDECDAGEICSRGLCLTAAGREACTSSLFCPQDESCDRTVFLCVPERPCATCDTTPELCCFPDEVCVEDVVGGVCEPLPQCIEDNDCEAPRLCGETGECVECDATHDCGPALRCDLDDGECFADGTCDADEDCNEGERCAVADQACVVPECQVATDCGDDPRLTCEQFRCELAPPVCPNDVDEENDDAATATEIVVGEPFAASLCRGDVDVLRFAVVPDTQYTATLEIVGSAAGLIVTMLNEELVVESSRALLSNETVATVSGFTEDDTQMYLALRGPTAGDQDECAYTVRVAAAP